MCRVFVRLGEHDMRTPADGSQQDVQVTHVLKHSGFDQEHMKNDIAVLYLKHDVNFTGK